MAGRNKLRSLVADRGARHVSLGQWIVLVAVLGFASCATSISGRIASHPQHPWKTTEARVNISRIAGEGSAPAPTVLEPDSSGAFKVRGYFPPGTYLIEALVPGFKIASKTVKIDEAKGLVFQLSPAPAARPGTIGANLDVDAGRGAGAATLWPPEL